MHFHPVPNDPHVPPAFCEEHAPDDEPMHPCDCSRVCVICEENSAPLEPVYCQQHDMFHGLAHDWK